jgi:formylglycine-generating enzyme required for sulfatase activity
MQGTFMRVAFTKVLSMLAVIGLLLTAGGCQSQKVSWEQSGKQLSINLGSTLPLELRRIEAGEFEMGSSPSTRARFAIPGNEQPAHPVKIAQPFYMAIHETTNEHFRRFSTEHDSNAAKATLPELAMAAADTLDLNEERLPAVGVSHADAVQYCKWLSLATGLTVRLPTEAEWEYACRAGTDTDYSWGDSRADGSSHANLADIATEKLIGNVTEPAPREDGKLLPSRVAGLSPNGKGLHDMHGNVAEWCQDVYSDSYNNAAADGSANTVGSDNQSFVVRGGSWASGMLDARSSARAFQDGSTADCMTGFRIVVEVPPSETTE